MQVRSLQTLLAPALAAALCLPSAAEGQTGATTGFPLTFQLQLRGGVDLPQDELADRSDDWNGVFGGDLNVAINRSLSGYFGWTRAMFDWCRDEVLPEDGECQARDDAHSSGLGFGARYAFGGARLFAPWVRGGAILHTLTVDFEGDEITSDGNFGLELGAGVDIPLGSSLHLAPAVRYYRYQADFEDTLAGVVDQVVGEPTTDVAWFQFDLGLGFTFTGR